MFPIFFELGPFKLHTFGLMVAIGFLVGGSFVARTGERAGFDRDQLWRVNLLVLAAVLVGGRLMFLIVELFRGDRYWKNPLDMLKIWQGGIAFYGGLLLTLIAVVWYARSRSLPLLKLCDLYAMGGFLGEGIGRWGCLFAGDDYGKPAPDLPWAVTFTDPESEVPRSLRGMPLHPTQLYLSALAIGIFLVGRAVYRKKKFDGQVSAIAFMIYAALRPIIELFRGDVDRGFVMRTPFEVSTSQFLSLWFLAIGAWLWWWASRQGDQPSRQSAPPSKQPVPARQRATASRGRGNPRR